MSDETAALLASTVYRSAFNKVMTGTDPAFLDDAERDAIRKARELTGTEGPGYPMPTDLDPTRSDDA